MNDPILSPCPQRTPARNAPESPLSSIPYPLSPAVSARNALLLLCLLFLLTACGRRPGQPTPLPAGTRVAQNTPDFSAPAQAESATQTADQVADSLRARLAQQRTPTAPTAAPPASADANPAPAPSALSAYPSLAVFSRPTALGILSAGGLLYSAPGAGAVANLQLGATLTITGRSADGVWFAAYLADGIAGWVPAAQVRVFGDVNELEIVQESLGPAVVATLIAEASKPQAPVATVVARLTPALPPPLPRPSPSPEITGPAVTVLVEGANLRAGPGTDFPIVGGLYQNESAALLGRNQTGDWLQLQLPASLGWIYAPLVQTTVPIAELPLIDPPPAPEPSPTP